MNHEEHEEREDNSRNTDLRPRLWPPHFVIFVSFVVNFFCFKPLNRYKTG